MGLISLINIITGTSDCIYPYCGASWYMEAKLWQIVVHRGLWKPNCGISWCVFATITLLQYATINHDIIVVYHRGKLWQFVVPSWQSHDDWTRPLTLARSADIIPDLSTTAGDLRLCVQTKRVDRYRYIV
jgi:hypothetical protein